MGINFFNMWRMGDIERYYMWLLQWHVYDLWIILKVSTKFSIFYKPNQKCTIFFTKILFHFCSLKKIENFAWFLPLNFSKKNGSFLVSLKKNRKFCRGFTTTVYFDFKNDSFLVSCEKNRKFCSHQKVHEIH